MQTISNQELIEHLKMQEEQIKKHYRLPNESDVDYRDRILEIKNNE